MGPDHFTIRQKGCADHGSDVERRLPEIVILRRIFIHVARQPLDIFRYLILHCFYLSLLVLYHMLYR